MNIRLYYILWELWRGELIPVTYSHGRQLRPCRLMYLSRLWCRHVVTAAHCVASLGMDPVLLMATNNIKDGTGVRYYLNVVTYNKKEIESKSA